MKRLLVLITTLLLFSTNSSSNSDTGKSCTDDYEVVCSRHCAYSLNSEIAKISWYLDRAEEFPEFKEEYIKKAQDLADKKPACLYEYEH